MNHKLVIFLFVPQESCRFLCKSIRHLGFCRYGLWAEVVLVRVSNKRTDLLVQVLRPVITYATKRNGRRQGIVRPPSRVTVDAWHRSAVFQVVEYIFQYSLRHVIDLPECSGAYNLSAERIIKCCTSSLSSLSVRALLRRQQYSHQQHILFLLFLVLSS